MIRQVLLAGALLLAGCIGYSGERPAVDPTELTPAHNTLTFWGHASVYLDLGGVGIVTDPVYDDSYSLLHRRIAPAPLPAAYAGTDLVLISHAHRDHLSPETLATFPPTAVVLCPEPSAEEILDVGLPIKIMRPWEAYGFPGGSVLAVPAYHPGGRNAIEPSADGRALGYLIFFDGKTIYYSGDSEYFPGFRAIGERFPPDVVLLNVNSHLHGEDAVRAVQDLGAPPVLGIHHGAFGWTNEARTPGWDEELEAVLGPVFTPLAVGDRIDLDAFSPDRPRTLDSIAIALAD